MTIQYQVYFKIPDGDWLNLENTYNTEITLSDDVLSLLSYFSVYQWRVDTYDTESELTTTGDTWEFISQKSPKFTNNIRRSDYNWDYVWNPIIGDWDDINDFDYTGGGRYKSRIIAIGHNCVYFGDL
jgi:hypothetical protein